MTFHAPTGRPDARTHRWTDERMAPLAALIAEAQAADGMSATAVPGLWLSRLSTTRVPRTAVDRAVLCVVAQGAKSILLDGLRHVYAPGTYLLVALDLPLVGQIEAATPDVPLLSVTLELDFAEVAALGVDAGLPAPSATRAPRGVAVSALDDELLDAVTRLVRLLRTPARLAVLAPLVRREIYYRLLLGEQGPLLRRMAAASGRVQRIAAGVEWLKRNATRPVRMEELAREVNMSASTMHVWFKAVTGMSPLQFQKQLRLQEARRILLSGSADAATAARRVGYDSPSQFSREYRRLFGAPPLRDVGRLRTTPYGPVGPAPSTAPADARLTNVA